MGSTNNYKSGHLKGLNGIRAICALILLWGHIPQPDFCNWGQILSLPLPDCCAYIFFVLSGFLAGYTSYSDFSTSLYYQKRARKILPLYYGYVLLSVTTFIVLGKEDDVITPNLLYYFFLAPSIPFCTTDGIIPLVHLWFIGTIVLFYAVFPLFVRIKNEKKPLAAICISTGWFLLKCFLYVLIGKDTFAYRFASVTAFDCCFFGVWLGLLWNKSIAPVVRIGENRFVAFVVWLLFLLSGFYGVFIPAPVRNEYMAVIAGLLILNQISDYPVLSLENRLFRYLGSISYEIYVVQILVIMLISFLYVYVQWQWHWIFIYLTCTITVIIIAAITSKILSHGQRFHQIRSQNH